MRTTGWVTILGVFAGCGSNTDAPPREPTHGRPVPGATVIASASTSASWPDLDTLASRKRKLSDETTTPALIHDLEGATIIGLGEQTHGSEANARARVDLVRLLVEKGNVRVVALEADFVEVLRIDAYVQGGSGDPSALLGRQRAGWIWDKPALRELIVWLRDLNAARPESQRVHVVGVDMQTGPAILDAITAALDARETKTFKRKLAAIEGCADHRLEPLLPELDQRAATRPVLTPLLRSLRQCRAASTEGPEGTALREQGMADNVLAASEAGGQLRVVVLAHNGHVSKIAIVPKEAPPMGARIADKIGARYVAIGTILGNGDFRGYRLDPTAGRSAQTEILSLGEPDGEWVEGVLKSAEPYYLPLGGWSGRPRKMRFVGASYAPDYPGSFVFPVSIERAFDGIVYLPHA